MREAADDRMGANVLAMVRSAVDAESFAAVFNAHHRQAVRLAYLLTSDHDQAEDIVSEAFAKVYVQWKRGRVNDIGAYLRRAVVNQANSKLRRRYLERSYAQVRTGDDRGVRRVDDDQADHDQVWTALSRLPDRQRQVIVLRYYEDLSEAQTADVLGISTGTVKSSMARGMARLEELLGAQEATGGGR